jgi:cytochrome c oxidase assembly protein subunit 15
MSDRQRLNIALWLLGICLVIFCMISLGGVTRLTGSGLSMVQWAPITGILPPLNETQWVAVFKLYQASPEFVKVNASLELEGFKSIFWFEYFHRLLGRFIGILFFIPMVYFFVRYPLPAKLRLQLLGLFVLGGLQGLMGWYMVKSGLVNDPHVSQYRLVAHLALALILYIAIFWLGSAYFIRNWTQRYASPAWLDRMSTVLFVLVFMTVLAGGFVAGTRAGFAFNTFPLMNGALIPEGYAALEPFWKNLFENIATVQFNHRLLATVSLVLAAVLARLAYITPLNPALKNLFIFTLLFVLLQYSLGILTLINYVPVSLGAVHQAMAVLVMTSSLFLVRVLAQLKH